MNPLGDEVLDELGAWWAAGPCVADPVSDRRRDRLRHQHDPAADGRAARRSRTARSRIVRLGQGVDATGRLAEEALERTFAALDDYAALIRSHGVTRVRLCATSATRDAANGDDFVDGVAPGSG